MFEARDVQPVISVARLLAVAEHFRNVSGSPCVPLERAFPVLHQQVPRERAVFHPPWL